MRNLILGFVFLCGFYVADAQSLTPGSIGYSHTICYGSAPNSLIELSAPTGGNPPYSYQWQRSNDDGSSWVIISRATRAVYSPPVIGRNTRFVRKVTDNSGAFSFSNEIAIAVRPVLMSGIIGSSQTVCYGASPSELVQLHPASGGEGGPYNYRWQLSTDSYNWDDIQNDAESQSYLPQGISADTWFRRLVTDPTCGTIGSSPVKITVNASLISAQLLEDATIPGGTSTDLSIFISGGSPPFTINYTRNNTEQFQILNYTSGETFSTGILAAGTYTYTLTSVFDANGCHAQELGNPITVSAGETRKALVIVNSESDYYEDYTLYIKPYLDNFGIPYDVYNSPSTSGLTSLTNYSIIIFGHKEVYSSNIYPMSAIEAALNNGVGLYSFDPLLFQYSSGVLSNPVSVSASNISQIDISTTPTHYITQQHVVDDYNPINNYITLRNPLSITQSSSLIGGTPLATLGSVSLIEISKFNNSGRIVKWNGYDWMFEYYKGPVFGMDDLIWRSIVWAARKPFVMQGLPPMITMRVDDVIGDDVDNSVVSVVDNFDWIRIVNDYGFIPWSGVMISPIIRNPLRIPILKSFIDSGKTTSSPHSADGGEAGILYFNHNNNPDFNVVDNVRAAKQWYIDNGLTMSSYLATHYSELGSEALPEIKDMGIEFLANLIPPDARWDDDTPWLEAGPYRIGRSGVLDEIPHRPHHYSDNVTWKYNNNDYTFFDCVTQIRDDAGYEWYPQYFDQTGSIARGIRQLKRSLNSMVLATLFTHEIHLKFLETGTYGLRPVMQGIQAGISGYNPEYTTMEYACRYIRAKNNIRITDVKLLPSGIEITYSGSNDMDTKCYLFTGEDSQITYVFVPLPQINGTNTVSY